MEFLGVGEEGPVFAMVQDTAVDPFISMAGDLQCVIQRKVVEDLVDELRRQILQGFDQLSGPPVYGNGWLNHLVGRTGYHNRKKKSEIKTE